jgi:acrylyl-CoA reductase (NADPH)
VQLIGVDSVVVSPDDRRHAWKRLASALSGDLIDQMTEVIPLDAVPAYSEAITNGRIRGRVVIDLNA